MKKAASQLPPPTKKVLFKRKKKQKERGKNSPKSNKDDYQPIVNTKKIEDAVSDKQATFNLDFIPSQEQKLLLSDKTNESEGQ